MNNYSIGDQVTFSNNDSLGGAHISGRIEEMNISSVDGFSLGEDEMPCHVVVTDDNCIWAVPVSWII